MFSVEAESLVARIHELVSNLQAQGRISVADVNTIYALTMHPDLPNFFRLWMSSPQNSRLGAMGDQPTPAFKASDLARRPLHNDMKVTFSVAGKNLNAAPPSGNGVGSAAFER